ncbi:MAG TPA: LapA family protein [Gammaproteobacteria bacterium]|nr:LapA family protein [Gammaproteobacteria bacterium]
MRIINFIIIILFTALGLAFTVFNAAPVSIEYYFGTVNVPLSLVLVGGFALGAFLGLAASVGMILKARRGQSRLRKKLEHTEKELKTLRSLPIKDAP